MNQPEGRVIKNEYSFSPPFCWHMKNLPTFSSTADYKNEANYNLCRAQKLLLNIYCNFCCWLKSSRVLIYRAGKAHCCSQNSVHYSMTISWMLLVHYCQMQPGLSLTDLINHNIATGNRQPCNTSLQDMQYWTIWTLLGDDVIIT